MDIDPRDAELIALRDEVEKLRKGREDDAAAMNAAEYLRDCLAFNQIESERRRRIDGYRIPSGVYEVLEDLGLLRAAIGALSPDKFWHQEEVREIRRALSKIEWSFRKKLHEYL